MDKNQLLAQSFWLSKFWRFSMYRPPLAIDPIPAKFLMPCYNDRGTGSKLDIQAYNPDFSQSALKDLYYTGSYCTDRYTRGAPATSNLCSISLPTRAAPAAVVPPVGWRLVWNDKESGGDNKGSIWTAIPPYGYLALGVVVVAGYAPPTGLLNDRYRCIRWDLCYPAVAKLLWTDEGSGATLSACVYTIEGKENIDDPGPIVGTGVTQAFPWNRDTSNIPFPVLGILQSAVELKE